MTTKQAGYLGHVLSFMKAGGRLGFESVKRSPKAARWLVTSNKGKATLIGATGAYVGYKTGRRLQEIATGYALPQRRR